jgi:hypothetical protein
MHPATYTAAARLPGAACLFLHRPQSGQVVPDELRCVCLGVLQSRLGRLHLLLTSSHAGLKGGNACSRGSSSLGSLLELLFGRAQPSGGFLSLGLRGCKLCGPHVGSFPSCVQLLLQSILVR